VVKLKKLLFPTDFSDHSNAALEYAIALAKAFEAKLFLLHVVDTFEFPPDLMLHHPALEPHTLTHSLLKEAQGRMTALAARVKRKGIEPITRVHAGKPFAEIISFAQGKKVHLIVMGTHGHSGLAHALLGSTTEKVVRKSPCPVLTVKKTGHEFEMP
jgi:nucleotide-binding universal stress UspA family protein